MEPDTTHLNTGIIKMVIGSIYTKLYMFKQGVTMKFPE